MDGFVESVNAQPKAAEYVQQIEMDRIMSRLAKFKAENPNVPRPSDMLRGHEDHPKMLAMMDNFIQKFSPDRGDGAFEQLVAMETKLAPDDVELRESIMKLKEQSSSAGKRSG
jgi:hypothetical protein